MTIPLNKTNNINRRKVLKLISKSLIYTATPSLPILNSCGFGSHNYRGFYFPRLFEHGFKTALIDIAFKVIKSNSKFFIDFFDIKKETFDDVFRIFTYTYEIGSLVLIISDPYVSIPVKITLVGTDLLIDKMLENGMNKAIALPTKNGYFVHEIAPTKDLKSQRSLLCYNIIDREPYNKINRYLPAVPDRINFFTHIVGANTPTTIYHRWIKNGRTIDYIPLKIGSNSWRTWSRKEHLASGEWLVLAETKYGEILDSGEFSIA